MIGIVYKVVFKEKYRPNNEDADMCYIGSTSRKLDIRWSQHKAHFKAWNSGKNRQELTIFKYFKKYDFAAFEIVELDRRVICDWQHILVFEQLAINRTKCINKLACFNPYSKIQRLLASKQWYHDNKVKISATQNEKFDCECGGRFTRVNKMNHIRTKKHINYNEISGR